MPLKQNLREVLSEADRVTEVLAPNLLCALHDFAGAIVVAIVKYEPANILT